MVVKFYSLLFGLIFTARLLLLQLRLLEDLLDLLVSWLFGGLRDVVVACHVLTYRGVHLAAIFIWEGELHVAFHVKFAEEVLRLIKLELVSHKVLEVLLASGSNALPNDTDLSLNQILWHLVTIQPEPLIEREPRVFHLRAHLADFLVVFNRGLGALSED